MGVVRDRWADAIATVAAGDPAPAECHEEVSL